ncbi:MAG: hypothetical protein V3W01_01040 [Dehalococcoidales bacterium]
MTSPRVSLAVSGIAIPIDGFALAFVENVVVAMLAALKGVVEIGSVHLSIRGDTVDIKLDGAPLPLNPFVSRFIKNTVLGMVSPLKGVGQIDELEISLTEPGRRLL